MATAIARALFYMAVRYNGDVSNEPALYLTDATAQITSITNLMGRLTTLLKWHVADPVDAAELLRNERVYSYQTNRNPFVDHPEWVIKAFIPQVNIVSAPQRVCLVWTNDSVPVMVPEQTQELGGPWVVVTNSPAISGTNTWVIALPIESGARMFRLRAK